MGLPIKEEESESIILNIFGELQIESSPPNYTDSVPFVINFEEDDEEEDICLFHS